MGQGVGGLREALEMLASRAERWVLGGCPDPSAAIEVSLGGLPPKGGSLRGERRCGSDPDRVYLGFQTGLADYGKRMKL